MSLSHEAAALGLAILMLLAMGVFAWIGWSIRCAMVAQENDDEEMRRRMVELQEQRQRLWGESE